MLRQLGWLGAALALLGPAAICAAETDDAGLLPITSFFRNPDIGEAALSPSGKWLAVTMPSKAGRVMLMVIDLQQPSDALKPIVSFGNTDVRSFDWVNDDYLIFNTIDFEDPLTQQTFGPGLFSIKRDGTGFRQLIRATGGANPVTGSSISNRTLTSNHTVIRILDDGSADIIVGEFRRVRGLTDVTSITPKRLDVTTGIATPLSAGAPDHVRGWVFDRAGRAVVAVAADKGQREVFWHAPDSDVWKSIAHYPATHMELVPRVVDAAGNLYVSDAQGYGRYVIKKFNFATGKSEADPMISAPGFDLTPSFVMDHDTGVLLGVRYQTDAAGVKWYDPDMIRMQALADEHFPGAVNVITCQHCATDGALLVRSYSDHNPGAFYLYRTATKTWQSIGKTREDVVASKMADLSFQRIKARDGEDLPVWVTMPKGKVDKPRAAVVLVHGGPWVRGTDWRWNGEAQFLASRGYVVIEPEFRGSTGYGSQHYEKGFRQWGGTMQADLVDAVHWAADKGMIDPARVCIAGGSYGGYAVLMGLVRDARTFKCGIAWMAVTDPRLLFEYNRQSDSQSEQRDFLLPETIGDPVKDADMLKDAAPVEHAKDIHAPVLMAVGGIDRRVPIEHGQRMVGEMRSQGLKPEYVIYDGEGHGLLKVANKVDFWTRVEHFLGEQLH